MRAVAITAPGGYEVLEVIDREAPEPGPTEIRIAVAAAAVNPIDSVLRSMGNPASPPPWIPGMDAVGTVESIGAEVERLEVGQTVMAAVNPRRLQGGAQAELVVVPEASAVPIPQGTTAAEASTLPMNGLTARLGLETLGLSPGDTLAISGGAGLVSSYAIGFATSEFGLRIIADAKGDEMDLVHSYGADVVVPRSNDFPAAIRAVVPSGADGLLDTAVLNEAGIGAVRDGGVMVTLRGWTPEADVRGIVVSPIAVGEVLDRTEWLLDLSRLAESSHLRPRVDSTYRPEEASAAARRMDAGGVRGRCVIVF